MFETAKALEPQLRKPDYKGLLIILCPVLLTFIYFYKPFVVLEAGVYLALVNLAARLRWVIRRHVWFWITIAVVWTLNEFIVIFAPLPQSFHSMAGMMLMALSSVFVTLGCLKIVEKLTGAKDELIEDS